MGKLVFILLLIICSGFMLYQHSTGLSWDISVYFSGARWFVGQEAYIELARPPMASMVMASLLPFGSASAGYAYVLACAVLSVCSAYLIYRKYGLPQAFVVLLVLNPLFLNTGTSVGTEAVAMATLLISIYLFPKPVSGVLFAASFLFRYPMLIYAPLFLLLADYKNPRRFLSQVSVFAAVAALTLSPWLLWNLINTGDPLFSIVDSYIFNIKARQYMGFNPSLSHFLDVSGVLTPLFIFGVFLSSGKPAGRMFMLLFALNTISYLITPHKEARYLFFIIPSVAYFSSLVSQRFGTGFTSLIAVLCILVSLTSFQALMPPETFSGVLDFLGSRNCSTISNVWVFFDYYGILSEPVPPLSITNQKLGNGTLLVIYRYTAEPGFILEPEFITNHTVLYEDSNFYVLGSGACKKPEKRIMTSYRWMLASYGIECC